MAQSYLMTVDQFEQKKNMKAGAYTAGIIAALAVLLLFVSWQLPEIAHPDPPLDQQGIEVNLGLDETGFGSDQPLLPGDPAPEANTAPAQSASNDAGEDAADDADSDVSVAKSETKKPVTKPVDPARVTASTTKPVTNPTPAPPRPKAQYDGKTAANSNGSGGNGADSYYKGGNQGVTSGRGDQGKPGGDPNSDSYSGNGRGNGGIRISNGLGGRRITGSYAFQDEFNRNATVYVDVTVDATGKVVTAKVNPRGTTTTDANIRSIAVRKAFQLKFNAGSTEQTGTLAFEFKVNG